MKNILIYTLIIINLIIILIGDYYWIDDRICYGRFLDFDLQLIISGILSIAFSFLILIATIISHFIKNKTYHPIFLKALVINVLILIINSILAGIIEQYF